MRLESIANTRDSLSTATAMFSFNENMVFALRANTTSDAEKFLKGMLNAAIVVFTRNNSAFVDPWVINTRNVASNMAKTLKGVLDKGIEIDEGLQTQILASSTFADTLICHFSTQDEESFGRIQATFNQFNFHCLNGIEKVQKIAKENPEMVALSKDPECRETTKLLNVLFRNKLNEADEMDIIGALSEIIVFPDKKSYSKYMKREDKTDNERGALITIEASGGGLLGVHLRYRDTMDNAMFASTKVLKGLIDNLKSIQKHEGADSYDFSMLTMLENLQETVKDGKPETYFQSFKPYIDDFDKAYDLIAKFNIGRIAISKVYSTLSEEAKIVLSMLFRCHASEISRCVKPITRDDMYIESMDWYAYLALIEAIGDAAIRVCDTDVQKFVGGKK